MTVSFRCQVSTDRCCAHALVHMVKCIFGTAVHCRLLRQLTGKAEGNLAELLRQLAPPGALRQDGGQWSAQAALGGGADSSAAGEQLRADAQQVQQQYSSELTADNSEPGRLAQQGNQLSHSVQVEPGAEPLGCDIWEHAESPGAGDGTGGVHLDSTTELAGLMATHTTTGASTSSTTRLFATDPHMDETVQLWVRLCHQHFVQRAARQWDGSGGAGAAGVHGAAEGSGGDGGAGAATAEAQAAAADQPARPQEAPAGPITRALRKASGTLLRQLFAGGAGTALRLDRDTLFVAVQLATHPGRGASERGGLVVQLCRLDDLDIRFMRRPQQLVLGGWRDMSGA